MTLWKYSYIPVSGSKTYCSQRQKSKAATVLSFKLGLDTSCTDTIREETSEKQKPLFSTTLDHLWNGNFIQYDCFSESNVH